MLNKLVANKGPFIETGTCRCCGNSKKCRLLNAEYVYQHQTEIYTDIFVECFGLLLSHLEGDPGDQLICATCVSRLREASAFKRQVLLGEERFLQSRLILHEDGVCDKIKMPIKEKLTGKDDESNFDDMDISQDISGNLPEKSSERVLDDDLLSFHNNATLIENSFICPFHTSYSKYSCVYCKADFLDPDKLRVHSLKHDPMKFKMFLSGKPVYFDIERIDCRLCDKRITDIDSFKTHIAEKHGKLIYKVKDNILRFRLKNGSVTCTDCSKSFTYFHALKRHMADHSGLFVCDVCGSHFFDRCSLEMHNRKSHKRLEENSCAECGKLFKSKHNLLYHISSVHKKQAAYQCSKCDLALYSLRDRQKHLLEVHGESRVFKCGTCSKVYNSMKALSDRNRTVHSKIFKYRCSVCDRGFALPSRLREHTMSTHRGERNYHCEFCGNSYPRLHYLKLHLQSHS